MFMGPLVWALTGYQIYLLWAGMTTNETSKWAELVLDIKDGIVFRRSLTTKHQMKEKFSRWPKEVEKIVVRTSDGKSPKGARADALQGHGNWTKVMSLGELENVYDLGLLKNAKDIFLRR